MWWWLRPGPGRRRHPRVCSARACSSCRARGGRRRRRTRRSGRDTRADTSARRTRPAPGSRREVLRAPAISQNRELSAVAASLTLPQPPRAALRAGRSWATTCKRRSSARPVRSAGRTGRLDVGPVFRATPSGARAFQSVRPRRPVDVRHGTVLTRALGWPIGRTCPRRRRLITLARQKLRSSRGCSLFRREGRSYMPRRGWDVKMVAGGSRAPPRRSARGALLDRRALGPRAAAARPFGPVAPVPARPLAGMVGIVTAARLLVLAHRHLALLDRPVVLLALPPAVAGVFEDRDTGKVDGALATRMVAPVLHVEHDASVVLVDHMPFVGGVDLAVLLHHRLDPGAHGLPAPHGAVEVLEVAAVLGEEIRPRVPVLAHRARAPVRAEGLLQLRAGELRHGTLPLTRRTGRSRRRGSGSRGATRTRRARTGFQAGMILSRACRAPPGPRKAPAYGRRGDIVKAGGRSVLRPARARVYGPTYLPATARTAPTRVPPRSAHGALPFPEPDREQDHDRWFDSGGVRRRGSRQTRGSHPDVPGG